MKNLLIKMGKKSRIALIKELDTKKKNKVLKDYCLLINRNKKLILDLNKKDIKQARNNKIKEGKKT